MAIRFAGSSSRSRRPKPRLDLTPTVIFYNLVWGWITWTSNEVELMVLPIQVEHAIDPICGMTVDPANAAGSYSHNGETYYFCSKGCLERFVAKSEAMPMPVPIQIGRASRDPHEDHSHAVAVSTHIDPVCGMSVDPATAAAEYEHDGKKYYFCMPRCKERFAAEPESFLSHRIPAETKSEIPNPQSQIAE